jgi:hypothetical protein
MGDKAMLNKDPHISDEELLLHVDGELSGRRTTQVKSHLAACWSCRARMAEIEGTILDFTRASREISSDDLPPIAGPRALLLAQMAELASKTGGRSRHWFWSSPPAMRTSAACVALLIAAMMSWLVLQHVSSRNGASSVTSAIPGVLPDARLTPGATRAATIDDLCLSAHEEVVGQVTTPLRDEVLKEYGIANERQRNYEIDYLIAPGLGGAEDIHNLWPQPYAAPTWNAYAKDALEERLHQLVCGRQLELGVAQRDIATDWVAAYKKYFQTDRPLPDNADIDSSTLREFAVAESRTALAAVVPRQDCVRSRIRPAAQTPVFIKSSFTSPERRQNIVWQFDPSDPTLSQCDTGR